MWKFHARQFSAWIMPTSLPPASRCMRIFPKTFFCVISPTGGAVGPANVNRDLMILRGRVNTSSGCSFGVADLVGVREELVEVRDEPGRLLELTLPDLRDRTDLVAVLVEDEMLGDELDELRLLVDDEDGLGEERAATAFDGATPALRCTWSRIFASAVEPVGAFHSSAGDAGAPFGGRPSSLTLTLRPRAGRVRRCRRSGAAASTSPGPRSGGCAPG